MPALGLADACVQAALMLRKAADCSTVHRAEKRPVADLAQSAEAGKPVVGRDRQRAAQSVLKRLFETLELFIR